MEMYKKSASEIHLKLKKHRGSITEVANRANVSRETVYQTLRGNRINIEVLEIASIVLKEKEDAKKKALGTIHKNLMAS